MTPEAIITVSAAVVARVQLAKWAGLPSTWGPVVVLALAAVGVGVWAWSQQRLPSRTDAFAYFSGWVVVATSAAGVFGFTRAAAGAVTAAKAPPGGAGQDPVVAKS